MVFTWKKINIRESKIKTTTNLRAIQFRFKNFCEKKLRIILPTNFPI